MKNENFEILTRVELKKIAGGVIDQETWMDLCLQGKFLDKPFTYDENSLNDLVRQEINKEMCQDKYDAMNPV